MAHRARLRRIEERTGPCSFRGARLARIPPPRQPLHRGLRIPDPRKISFSPLRSPAPRKTCRFLPWPIHTRRPFVPNDTFKTRSPRCEGAWRSPWRNRSIDVRAVTPSRAHASSSFACDAVELGGIPLNRQRPRTVIQARFSRYVLPIDIRGPRIVNLNSQPCAEAARGLPFSRWSGIGRDRLTSVAEMWPRG